MINEKNLPIIDNAEEERCWFLISQLESRINQLEIDFAQIRDDQSKIRDDQSKIKDDQGKIRDGIKLELKYSEEDLVFYRHLNKPTDRNYSCDP